ncbi:hypothetical protein C0J52_24534 [Blattella germanica]|nr:hypothetical protein C0J52_24534 [Blattella germanica]
MRETRKTYKGNTQYSKILFNPNAQNNRLFPILESSDNQESTTKQLKFVKQKELTTNTRSSYSTQEHNKTLIYPNGRSGRFQFITHYFPIRGHSYLPCDRDFSMVKRKIRKMDRIYLLKELIIESSKKMNFEVKIAKTEEVLNFKEWWPQFYRKNAISVETQGRATHINNKQHFHVTQFMQFCYSHETVGVVKVRSFIDGAEEHTFQLTEPSKMDQDYLQCIVIIPSAFILVQNEKKAEFQHIL